MSKFSPCPDCLSHPCKCGERFAEMLVTDGADDDDVQCVICGDVVSATDCASFNPPICWECDAGDTPGSWE